MTETEVTVLVSFLTSGLLAGVVANWLDQLASFIRRR